MDRRTQAKAVRSPRGTKVTENDWAAGHTGTINFVEPSDLQCEIDQIEPVGNYALRLVWFDGHGSGLYSYKYLRALCQCDACRPGATKDERGELPRL